MTEEQAAELTAKVRELIARGDPWLRILIRKHVVLEWLIEQARRPDWPLPVRLAIAEDRPAIRALAVEIAASDGVVEDESLSYALGVVDAMLEVLRGSNEALRTIKDVTGTWGDFAKYFERNALARGFPSENPQQDALSAVFQMLCKWVDNAQRGHRPYYRDQRAALATSVRHAISDAISEAIGEKAEPDPSVRATSLEVEPAAPVPALSAEQRISLLELIERDQVTQRQREWFQLYLQGLEGKGIADALGISTASEQRLRTRALETARKIVEADGGDF